MKKLLLASLSMVLMTIGQAAVAEDMTQPAAPTGSAATPAPHAMREARKQQRAERKAAKGEMVEKVKAACSADIQASGCGQELGKGLMKCIHAYKVAHPEFAISESCKAAVHDGREMRKMHKGGDAHSPPNGAAPAAPAAAPAGAPTH